MATNQKKLDNLILKLSTNDTTLDTVNLANRKLNIHDLQNLVKALKNNTVVTKLNLSSNNIDDEGVALIATLLKNNQSLVSICLHDNNIEDKEIRYIADALKVNTKMKENQLDLDLACNLFNVKRASKLLGEIKILKNDLDLTDEENEDESNDENKGLAKRRKLRLR